MATTKQIAVPIEFHKLLKKRAVENDRTLLQEVKELLEKGIENE